MKHRILLLSIIGLMSCVFASATGIDPKDGPGKGDEMSGNVFDAETKKPLREVTITAYVGSRKEKYVLSDELGRYGFDDLKPGTYKIVFEREGYKKIVREKIIIKADETFQMNIEMIETGDIDIMPSNGYFMDNK